MEWARREDTISSAVAERSLRKRLVNGGVWRVHTTFFETLLCDAMLAHLSMPWGSIARAACELSVYFVFLLL